MLHRRSFPAIGVALVALSGCSGQGFGTRNIGIPFSQAALPRPPALTAAFIAGLPRARLAPMPAGLVIPAPAVFTDPAALHRGSTVGNNDNEVVGTVINAGGPYTGIYAQQTAYLPANVPLGYPNGATGLQQVLAPVAFPSNGSCLASGTVAVNKGSGVATYFTVFDVCGGGFKRQIVAVPIDANFMTKYVTNTPATQNLPVYTTVVGTSDAVPTKNSTWTVMIYNNASLTWETVAQEKGLNRTTYGLSSYISYYQPGACPSGLPTLSANQVQLYNANTAAYEFVIPKMASTTTSILNRASSAQCFHPDSSGPATSTLNVVTANYFWTITSGPPSVGYQYDDWIEYAHDNLHTGFQPQPTGISNTTAQNLALRWKVAVPNGMPIYASPVVYNGNVVVVTDPPHAVVYDLSAVDGHVLWSYQVQGEVRGTPTIDPTTQLVFVGDRLLVNGGPAPSNLYALHLANGAIAWTTQVNGNTHAGPVVSGGVVYQGTSGGDSPTCLNGGVTALDEMTGATKWTWYVNSQVNPLGGGSAWGAIAFDGAHLIFGTGNTCGTTKYTTANGAVALDINGNALWSFVAEQNSYWDYDTGSSVMISHGNASFKNKTGLLYTVDASSGALKQQTMVDPNFGYGEFPSPSTDGSTTVISWGLNPNGKSGPRKPRSATEAQAIEAQEHEDLERIERHTRRHPFDALNGYHSSLVGINSSGTVIWTHTMNAMLDGYAAIVNGVVFADNDDALTAFDMRNGNQLWTYAFPSLPAASPAVVPSGVYATDGSGTVYAFALPHS